MAAKHSAKDILSVFFFGSFKVPLYQKTGNLVMAEKVFLEAINIDPTAFEAW